VILLAKIMGRAFFSSEILPIVLEFDEPVVILPKSGPCSKANREDTGPKKSPGYGQMKFNP